MPRFSVEKAEGQLNQSIPKPGFVADILGSVHALH
jgi:hypothetical protein